MRFQLHGHAAKVLYVVAVTLLGQAIGSSQMYGINSIKTNGAKTTIKGLAG